MKRAFIFPGQGSQAVGMGREVYDAFAEARDVFHEVDDALSQKLSKLIFEGPIEDLTLTENAQPALMAVSIAIHKVLEKQGNKKIHDLASYVAGHSLGEYTALTAAGSLSVADSAKLLRIRGSAMQQAVPQGQGGMAALIGADLAVAEKIAAEAAKGQICQVANDNSDGQVVISGNIEAVKRAEEVAKANGIKRFVMLNVSAPFHSKLMEPAAKRMQDALSETEIKKPAVPLVANVTANETQDPAEIKRLLVEQVTGRVRWRESVICLGQNGVNLTVEIGSGKVLSGLTKRIVKEMDAASIQTPQDIENYLKLNS